MMTGRSRVRAILEGRKSDRPAVICPGGMMSLAAREVMERTGLDWPKAHVDGETMLGLALAMQDATGFDNVAAPFCMTVEAEAFGAQVDLGDATRHPRVKGFLLKEDLETLPDPDWNAGRAGTLLDVLRELRRRRPDLALIGNVVGPFSLLGSLRDPLKLLRMCRRKPETVAGELETLTGELTTFARMQLEAGAEVLCIADPTATGEILGGELFGKLVAPMLKRMVKGIQEAGGCVIVHICGDARTILGELEELEAEAVSFDSIVDIVKLRQKDVRWEVMGNLDTFVLENGPTEVIRKRCEQLVRGGVRLVAPACGVVTTTPANHLRTMREAVDAAKGNEPTG